MSLINRLSRVKQTGFAAAGFVRAIIMPVYVMTLWERYIVWIAQMYLTSPGYISGKRSYWVLSWLGKYSSQGCSCEHDGWLEQREEPGSQIHLQLLLLGSTLVSGGPGNLFEQPVQVFHTVKLENPWASGAMLVTPQIQRPHCPQSRCTMILKPKKQVSDHWSVVGVSKRGGRLR